MGLHTREYYRTLPESLKFRKSNYTVDSIASTLSAAIAQARPLVERYHYSAGASKTAAHIDGLYDNNQGALVGVAWWLPPTKVAALSVATDPNSVVGLSRFVLAPFLPPNAASFFLAASMKRVPGRYRTLLTYADQGQGHTGHIYRVTGWEYLGETQPKWVYYLNGRMLSAKIGPVTRSHTEMLTMGCTAQKTKKHKFRYFRLAV